MCHNESCLSQQEGTGFGCPVCEEMSPDDPALKNHILDVHLQPELLNIKQEPNFDQSTDEEDVSSTECDDTLENEGNTKRGRRRLSVRKACKKASTRNKNSDAVDVDSLGTHFLDGYGN